MQKIKVVKITEIASTTSKYFN